MWQILYGQMSLWDPNLQNLGSLTENPSSNQMWQNWVQKLLVQNIAGQKKNYLLDPKSIFNIPLWLSSDLTLDTEFKLDLSVTKKYIGSKYHLARLKKCSNNTFAYDDESQSAVVFTHSPFLGTALTHAPISHNFCASISLFACHSEPADRYREYPLI